MGVASEEKPDFENPNMIINFKVLISGSEGSTYNHDGVSIDFLRPPGRKIGSFIVELIMV